MFTVNWVSVQLVVVSVAFFAVVVVAACVSVGAGVCIPLLSIGNFIIFIYSQGFILR